MDEKRDYRVRLSEEQTRSTRVLFRGRNITGCSFDGLCMYKARHLNPSGLNLCICDDLIIKNFGCNYRGLVSFSK